MRLPEFIAHLSQVSETLAAIETETEGMANTVADKNAQFCVATATDSLALWEEDYGLSSEGDADSRRNRILAWLWGSSALTPELVCRLSEVFTGAAAEASEAFDRYLLEMRLSGNCRNQERLDELITMLREKLPAHLALKCIFPRYTYNQMEQYTYDILENWTYDELEGVILT